MSAADASVPSSRQEVVLAEGNGLKAVLRVKPEASLADQDWLQLEITNNGSAAVITQGALTAPALVNGLRDSDLLAGTSIGIAPAVPGLRSHGFSLPAGTLVSNNPAIYADRSLDRQAGGAIVTANVSLNLVLNDGRTLKSPAGGVPLQFTWVKTDVSEQAALQKELDALLAKTSPSSIGAVVAPLPSNQPREFSPRLTGPENTRLAALLETPEVTRNLNVQQVLAAVQQSELDKSIGPNPLMGLVVTRWPKDPAVIQFFRDGLTTQGSATIFDVMSPGIWDDSFLEPVIKLVESTAPLVALPGRGGTAPGADLPSLTFSRALNVLSRNYAAWSSNAAVASQLSRAVRVAYPSLTGGPGAAPLPGTQGFSNAMMQLAETHDHTMVAVLRPFLAVKVIDGNGILGSDRTPFRVCEVAANSICTLLGEPQLFSGSYSNAGFTSTGDYPEWTVWDQQIADLQKHLDAPPKN